MTDLPYLPNTASKYHILHHNLVKALKKKMPILLTFER